MNDNDYIKSMKKEIEKSMNLRGIERLAKNNRYRTFSLLSEEYSRYISCEFYNKYIFSFNGNWECGVIYDRKARPVDTAFYAYDFVKEALLEASGNQFLHLFYSVGFNDLFTLSYLKTKNITKVR